MEESSTENIPRNYTLQAASLPAVASFICTPPVILQVKVTGDWREVIRRLALGIREEQDGTV
jgi:hypothetical protein